MEGKFNSSFPETQFEIPGYGFCAKIEKNKEVVKILNQSKDSMQENRDFPVYILYGSTRIRDKTRERKIVTYWRIQIP